MKKFKEYMLIALEFIGTCLGIFGATILAFFLLFLVLSIFVCLLLAIGSLLAVPIHVVWNWLIFVPIFNAPEISYYWITLTCAGILLLGISVMVASASPKGLV